MKLYSYWRSTTSYRVRIALELKELSYRLMPIDLRAGAQNAPKYAAINPAMGVPTLKLENGTVLTQSMAILEWLDEKYPAPPLLPRGATDRALVRAAALGIACDIHPINNLRVLNQLKTMGHDTDATTAWMHHWMAEGLGAAQKLIESDTPFCFGAAPGLADICLIPQLYNARRWKLDLTPFTRLLQVEARCLALPAFAAAHPDKQPDAT